MAPLLAEMKEASWVLSNQPASTSHPQEILEQGPPRNQLLKGTPSCKQAPQSPSTYTHSTAPSLEQHPSSSVLPTLEVPRPWEQPRDAEAP